MNKLIISSLLFFLLLFSSCEKREIYQKSYPLKDAEWTYSDSLDFSFNIQDTDIPYDLDLGIRHSKDYAFQNLYVRITTFFPSGEQVEDVVSMELAQKDGNWYGDCGKDDCLLVIPTQQHIRFKEAGDYQIVIEQFMRKKSISGIKEISFSIFKAEQK